MASLKDKNDRVVANGDTVLIRGEVLMVDQIAKDMWIVLRGTGSGETNPQPDAARRIKVKAGDVEKV